MDSLLNVDDQFGSDRILIYWQRFYKGNRIMW